jgi:hypothetical protein
VAYGLPRRPVNPHHTHTMRLSRQERLSADRTRQSAPPLSNRNPWRSRLAWSSGSSSGLSILPQSHHHQSSVHNDRLIPCRPVFLWCNSMSRRSALPQNIHTRHHHTSGTATSVFVLPEECWSSAAGRSEVELSVSCSTHVAVRRHRQWA